MTEKLLKFNLFITSLSFMLIPVTFMVPLVPGVKIDHNDLFITTSFLSLLYLHRHRILLPYSFRCMAVFSLYLFIPPLISYLTFKEHLVYQGLKSAISFFEYTLVIVVSYYFLTSFMQFYKTTLTILLVVALFQLINMHTNLFPFLMSYYEVQSLFQYSVNSRHMFAFYVSFGYFFSIFKWSETYGRKRLIPVISLTLLIFLISSKHIVLSISVTLFIIAAVKRQSTNRQCIMLAAGLIILFLVLFAADPTLSLLNIDARMSLWSKLPHFLGNNNLLFGSGFNTFHLINQGTATQDLFLYNTGTGKIDIVNTSHTLFHSTPLQLLIETGIIGFILYHFLCYRILVYFSRVRKDLFTSAFLIFFFLINFFGSALYVETYRLFLFFIMGYAEKSASSEPAILE